MMMIMMMIYREEIRRCDKKNNWRVREELYSTCVTWETPKDA